MPEDDNIELSESRGNRSNNLFGFLVTMWHQTVPLFERKYLRSTLIVCITQFWLYVITNGLYMWFPYIINAMGEFMKNHPDDNQRMCQIVYDKHEKLRLTESSNTSTVSSLRSVVSLEEIFEIIHLNFLQIFSDCPDKLENTTYMYSLLMETLYVTTFAAITFIVNRVGKIPIMCKYPLRNNYRK